MGPIITVILPIIDLPNFADEATRPIRRMYAPLKLAGRQRLALRSRSASPSRRRLLTSRCGGPTVQSRAVACACAAAAAPGASPCLAAALHLWLRRRLCLAVAAAAAHDD